MFSKFKKGFLNQNLKTRYYLNKIPVKESILYNHMFFWLKQNCKYILNPCFCE